MRWAYEGRKDNDIELIFFFFFLSIMILGWDRKKQVARGILSIPFLFLLPANVLFQAHLFHHFRLRYLLSPSNFIRFHDGIKFFSFRGSRLCSSFSLPVANRTIENVASNSFVELFFYLIILV